MSAKIGRPRKDRSVIEVPPRPAHIPLDRWLYTCAKVGVPVNGGEPGEPAHARYLAAVSVRFHTLLRQYGIHVEGA